MMLNNLTTGNVELPSVALCVKSHPAGNGAAPLEVCTLRCQSSTTHLLGPCWHLSLHPEESKLFSTNRVKKGVDFMHILQPTNKHPVIHWAKTTLVTDRYRQSPSLRKECVSQDEFTFLLGNKHRILQCV